MIDRRLAAAVLVLGVIGLFLFSGTQFSIPGFGDDSVCGTQVIEISGQTFNSLQELKDFLGENQYQEVLSAVESDDSVKIIENLDEDLKVENCIENQ